MAAILSNRLTVNYLSILALFLVSIASSAQTKRVLVALRPGIGVGISNKPNVMFGAPFAISGELGVTFKDRWRVAVDGGAAAFRDSKHPYDKLGLILSGYSRYDHQYVGLLAGRSLLKADQFQNLFFSTGADYLLLIDPNVKTSSGWFGGKSFHYQYYRYVNVPIQLDYSARFSRNKQARMVITGRWNINAYHSFPTIRIGVDLPIYMVPRKPRYLHLQGT